MSTVGNRIRELREKAGISLRKAAVLVDIDVAILSKMETGKKQFTKELLFKFAKLYKVQHDELIILFLSDKIIYEIKDEELGLKALKVAEKQVKYIK